MNLLRPVILFSIIALLTVSSVSADGYRHHHQNWYDLYSWEDYRLDYDYNYPDNTEYVVAYSDTDSYQDTDTNTENYNPPETVSNSNDYTLKKLCRDNVCIVGGNDQTLVLRNYKAAKNPSYDELIAFLRVDDTDEIPYTSRFVCSDFAVRLHNNAEKAGIKMGWCSSENCNHAWNIVDTTDRGIVHIDCTGVDGGETYQDKLLTVKEGHTVKARYLFRNGYGTMDYGNYPDDLLVYW